MPTSYEKVIGYIGDLLAGDGERGMAKYIDCPVCRAPLDITIIDDDELLVTCPTDRRHMAWHGFYNQLPEWIGEYRKLNP